MHKYVCDGCGKEIAETQVVTVKTSERKCFMGEPRGSNDPDAFYTSCYHFHGQCWESLMTLVKMKLKEE